MSTVTLTSKGQLTLPVAIRQSLGLRESEKLEVSINLEQQTITLRKPSRLEDLSAKYGKLIPKGAEPVTDASAYYQAHRAESIR